MRCGLPYRAPSPPEMKVDALKTDLEVKSKAATAGWGAAADAESQAAAAEARGLQAGIKRGQSEAEKKVGYQKKAGFRAASNHLLIQASPKQTLQLYVLGECLGSGHQTRARTGAERKVEILFSA